MFHVLLMWVMVSPLLADVVMMNPTTRLKGNIASDSLSRIAVVNDRITHVFGDQDAYEIVMDETIGQVFIKPTVANGSQPISLSLVMESQCTQDLLLTPSSMEAATLLFHNPSHVRKADKTTHVNEDANPSAHFLEVMKRWIVEEDVYSDASNPPAHHTYPGCSGELMVWKQMDGYTVSRWMLGNTTSTPLNVSEESFYQQDDLAIVIQHKTLEVGQSTVVYVVSVVMEVRHE